MTTERLTDEELDSLEAEMREVTPARGYGLRLVAEVRASRGLLAEIEWAANEDGVPYCVSCGVDEAENTHPKYSRPARTHNPGCKLAALLGREERQS